MALVSGGRSTLNPNAPLFIPAAVRQVEDFSPEWWDLVTTATWFREYWLSQQQGENIFGEDENDFYGNDVVEALPDNIDLDMDEDIWYMKAQFKEFFQSSEAKYGSEPAIRAMENGKNADALMKSLHMPTDKGHKSPREGKRYWEKPAKHVAPKHSPRFIQQPR